MSQNENQIEIHFYHNEARVTCLKITLVRNGKRTCIADVPVFSRHYAFTLPAENLN